ncbi:hypothetical protein BGE01nite_56890 [Brevifollis gellanilyticus]|uniref:Ig-like domain-containing protein n=2 Tax=Brevifollis gellanilyticus TaxID=748831 RepID=A0A512MI48_9BACT|nr:hypothetical protein BGE01nite_56890 [Brevifollis gellanilyticus]
MLPPSLRVCLHVLTTTAAALLPLTSAQAEQLLGPASYTGIMFSEGAGHGSVIVSSGEWMAVGAPGNAIDPFTTYAGGRVTLWKREAGTWQLRQQIVSPESGTGSGNQFGRKLAMEGDRLLIGSVTTAATPRVHVYRRENETWAQDGTLTSVGGSSASGFGEGLAISGDLAVIGSPSGDGGTPTGWIEVYQRTGGSWAYQTRLTDPQNGPGLGLNLAIHGGSIIIAGRPFGDILTPTLIQDVGKIAVFEKPAAVWQKTREVLSSSPTANERLGLKLQVQGNRLYALGNGPLSLTNLHEFAITSAFAALSRFTISLTNPTSALLALASDGTKLALHNGGQADPLLFHRPSVDDLWLRDTVPVQSSSNITETAFLWSGEDLLIGGSAKPYIFGPQEHTVRVLRRSDTAWAIIGHCQPPVDLRLQSARFGLSVAQDGEWLVTGAPISDPEFTEYEGLAFVYRKSAQGAWQFHSLLPQPVQPGVNLAHFGGSVACSGTSMAVSLSRALNGELLPTPSAVFLYAWDAAQGRWVQDGNLTAPAGKSAVGFGHAIALLGDLLAIGSPQDRTVFLYRRSGGQWTLTQTLAAPTSSPASESFGWSLSLDGTSVLIGAPTDSAGSAYLYEQSGGTWTQTTRLQPPATPLLVKAGITVNLNADRALLGGDGETTQAAIFQRTGTTWKHQGHLPVDLTGITIHTAVSGVLFGPFALLNNGYQLSLHSFIGSQWTPLPLGFETTMAEASTLDLDLPARQVVIGTFYRGIYVKDLARPPGVDLDGELTTVPGSPVFLDAGEYLAGKVVNRLLGIKFAPQGAFTVRTQVSLGGDTASFSLARTSWDVPPGSAITEALRFAPTTAGVKEITLTFTSDAPGDSPVVYHIRARAVTTATPVQFLGVPDSVLMQAFDLEHAQVPLEPVITGTGPWTFRWLKNGTAIPGATNRTLSVSSAGVYQLDVTNPAGRIRSPAINIGSYELKTPVLLALDGETVRAVMAVAGPGVKVRWSADVGQGTGPLSDGPYYTGTRSPTLTIRNAQSALTGSYFATVSMPTVNGPIELDSEMAFAVVARPLITLEGREDGRMVIGQPAELWSNVSFDGPSADPPVFRATGLPPGLTQGQDGFIRGTPTTVGLYTLSVTASIGRVTSLPVSRRFVVVTPGSATPGLYWGWLEGHPAFPLRGAITLDLRPDGSYTGTLQTGLYKEAISGMFPSGQETGFYESAITRLALRFPAPQTQRNVWFRHEDGARLIEFLSVPPGGQPSDLEPLSSLELITPLVLPQAPPPELGKHNFVFQSDGDPVSTPGGHAFGTLTVAADRRVTFVGQLSDGSGITGAGWLSDQSSFSEETPKFYFYATDTAGKNSIRGRVGISLVSGGGVAGPSGDVLWTRLPSATKFYPDGFEDTPFAFVSSRYSATSAGLVFSEGPFSLQVSPVYSETTPSTVQFSRQLRATFGTGPGENLIRARLDVYAITGFFTGQATVQQLNVHNPDLPITRTLQYRGMLLPDARRGYGYFLLTTPIDGFVPASEARTYSTPVLITPAFK